MRGRDTLCKRCGHVYVRDSGREFRVVLRSLGSNRASIASLIATTAGLTVQAARRKMRALPLTVAWTGTRSEAEAIQRQFEELDCRVEVLRKDEPLLAALRQARQPQRQRQSREEAETPGPVRLKLMTIALQLALAALLGAGWFFLQHTDLVFQVVEDYLARVGQPGRFERVEVLVMARSLPAGAVLQRGHLAARRLDRDDLPPDCIAPLDLEEVLGAVLIRSLDRGMPLRRTYLRRVAEGSE
jgi:hypothetical protein